MSCNNKMLTAKYDKNTLVVVSILVMSWMMYRVMLRLIKIMYPVRPYVPTHVVDMGTSTSINVSPIYKQTLSIKRPISPPKQDDMV